MVANSSVGGTQSQEDVAFDTDMKSGLQLAVSAHRATLHVLRLIVVSGCTYNSDYNPDRQTNIMDSRR